MMRSWSNALRGMPSARCSRIVLAGLLAVALGACTDSVGPDGELMDRILFLSDREGGIVNATPLTNIYVMNADGSEIEKLTPSPAYYTHLDVTPDGRTVIFEAGTWAGSCRQIWTMATDGSQLKAVTDDCSSVPQLSPNGLRFAYWRGRSIHVSNIDGSDPRDVAYALPPVGAGCTPEPSWDVRPLGWVSSDRVMFYRYICGQGYTYYSVDIYGTGLTELEFDAQTAYLSPDRTRIAYDQLPCCSPDWPTPRVTVMNVDGSGLRSLVQNAAFHGKFSYLRTPWSPDGTRLYYRTSEGHHLVDVDRAEIRRISDPTFLAEFNGWSPRGDRIAFSARTNPSDSYVHDIYVMNADGSGVVNLTNHASRNGQAVWVSR